MLSLYRPHVATSLESWLRREIIPKWVVSRENIYGLAGGLEHFLFNCLRQARRP